MNGLPWTDMELQELYEVVNDIDWFEGLYLPGRSPAAVRTRMCQLRIEAGIIPQRNGPRSFSRSMTERDKARYASDRLKRALQETEAA